MTLCCKLLKFKKKFSYRKQFRTEAWRFDMRHAHTVLRLFSRRCLCVRSTSVFTVQRIEGFFYENALYKSTFDF